MIIRNRLFQLLPGEIPRGLKAILHFFHAAVIIPETSRKLKSSIMKMGCSVTHVIISNFPGCPCRPHMLWIAVPALRNVLFPPMLLPQMCHQKQPDPSLEKIRIFLQFNCKEFVVNRININLIELIQIFNWTIIFQRIFYKHSIYCSGKMRTWSCSSHSSSLFFFSSCQG